MATARKGSKTQSKIQVLLYGEQFTGKSTLALQLMYLKRPDGKPFRVLYLDAENGSVDDYLGTLEDDGIDLENLYIVYTQSLNEVNEYIKKATNKEEFYELDEEGNEDLDSPVLDADGQPFIPDAIVVDGSTVLNLATKQGLIEFSKKRASVKAKRDELIGDEKFVKVEGAGLELKDYNTINFKGQDLVLTLTGSGLHYVVTARETNEKENKIIDGKKETVDTGRKIPEGFKGMGYNTKTEMRLFVEDGVVKAHVIKDRTHTYRKDDIIEDPTLLAFQAVIDKTKSNRDVVIQNRLHDAIKNELKQTEKEVLGEEFSEETSQQKESIDDVKKELRGLITSFSPAKKAKMKDELAKKGLPTVLSKISDIDIAKAALEVIKQI